jgi:hypothetical protein
VESDLTAINPSHYKDGWSDGAELISITENLNFNRGNAIKYIARAGKKDPATLSEDLDKALWYLTREIGRVKECEVHQTPAWRQQLQELSDYLAANL